MKKYNVVQQIINNDSISNVVIGGDFDKEMAVHIADVRNVNQKTDLTNTYIVIKKG